MRPQQHVAMRGLCAAMLTGLSTTTLASSVRGYGWGSVVRDADGYAPTEVWEKYCGERSTIASP